MVEKPPDNLSGMSDEQLENVFGLESVEEKVPRGYRGGRKGSQKETKLEKPKKEKIKRGEKKLAEGFKEGDEILPVVVLNGNSEESVSSSVQSSDRKRRRSHSIARRPLIEYTEPSGLVGVSRTIEEIDDEGNSTKIESRKRRKETLPRRKLKSEKVTSTGESLEKDKKETAASLTENNQPSQKIPTEVTGSGSLDISPEDPDYGAYIGMNERKVTGRFWDTEEEKSQGRTLPVSSSKTTAQKVISNEPASPALELGSLGQDKNKGSMKMPFGFWDKIKDLMGQLTGNNSQVEIPEENKDNNMATLEKRPGVDGENQPGGSASWLGQNEVERLSKEMDGVEIEDISEPEPPEYKAEADLESENWPPKEEKIDKKKEVAFSQFIDPRELLEKDTNQKPEPAIEKKSQSSVSLSDLPPRWSDNIKIKAIQAGIKTPEQFTKEELLARGFPKEEIDTLFGNEKEEGVAKTETEEGKTISEAKSWGELEEILSARQEVVQGSREDFTPEELKNIIDGVRKGDWGVEFVTRSEGLRDKVTELLKAEKEQAEQGPIHVQAEVVDFGGNNGSGKKNGFENGEAIDADFTPIEATENKNNIPNVDPEIPILESTSEDGAGQEAAEAARTAFEEAGGLPEETVAERIARLSPNRSSLWERIGKSRVWGFMWERVKGLGTAGIYEFYKAEQFRRRTKKSGKDIEIQSRLVEKEERLSYEEAQEEAEIVRAQLEREGNNNPTQEDYERVSRSYNTHILEKADNNKEVVNRIVADALAGLAAKFSEKYKGEAGQRIMTPERLQAIENRLRENLTNLRRGQIDKDFEGYRKMLRKGLDEKWWRRYVWGAIDAALWAGGASWLVMKYGAGKSTVGLVKEGVKQVIGPGESTPSKLTLPELDLSGIDEAPSPESVSEATSVLKDNLWSEGKRILISQGIDNPTDQQIMEITKQLVVDNETTVTKWGMVGKILDTKMPVGMAIKIGKAVALAARMASGV